MPTRFCRFSSSLPPRSRRRRCSLERETLSLSLPASSAYANWQPRKRKSEVAPLAEEGEGGSRKQPAGLRNESCASEMKLGIIFALGPVFVRTGSSPKFPCINKRNAIRNPWYSEYAFRVSRSDKLRPRPRDWSPTPTERTIGRGR